MSDHNGHLYREIGALRGRIDYLEEENRQLKAALREDAGEGTALGLSPSERTAFGVLLKREVATREQIMTALYFDRPDDPPDRKIVDVIVCKMRRKLSARGIAIETVWGVGWRMSAAMKDRARALARGETPVVKAVARAAISEERKAAPPRAPDRPCKACGYAQGGGMTVAEHARLERRRRWMAETAGRRIVA